MRVSEVKQEGENLVTLSTKVRTPLERAQLQSFSKRLTELMLKAGMSQSDLARAVWGSTTDSRGQDVARNRDRVSHYVRGSQLPEPKTLRKLATVLGCEVEDLSPVQGTQAEAEGRAPQEISMTVLGGRPDMALLTINKVLPLAVVIEILSLVTKATAAEEKSGVRKPTPV